MDSPVSDLRKAVSVLDLCDHDAVGHSQAHRGRQTGDGAGFVGVDGLFHLHRLQDHYELADLDDLAFLDRDLDDCSLHRCGQGVARGSGSGLAAPGPSGSLLLHGATATTELQSTGQNHLEALTTDLDDHALALAGLFGSTRDDSCLLYTSDAADDLPRRP